MKNHSIFILAAIFIAFYYYEKSCPTCQAANSAAQANNPLSVLGGASVVTGHMRVENTGNEGGPQPTFTAQGSGEAGQSTLPGTYSPGLHGGIPVPGHPIFLRQSETTATSDIYRTGGGATISSSRLNVRRVIN